MSKILKAHEIVNPEGFDVINLENNANGQFSMMHDFLFEGKFKTMSNDARTMYTLMRDRTNLSIRNKLADDAGRVVIFYTNKELQDKLNLSDKTVTKVQNELKTFGLIDTKQQGLGKPNVIYVFNPITPENGVKTPLKSISNGVNTQNFTAFDSRVVEPTSPDLNTLRRNHTEPNHTDASQNIPSPPIVSTNPPEPKPEIKPDETDENRWDTSAPLFTFDEARKRIMNNIEYDALATERPEQQEFLDKIVKAITDGVTAHYSSGYMYMSGRQIPLLEIREVFFSLTKEDILEFFLHFSRQQKEVKKPEPFIRAALYNNKTTQSGRTLQLLNDQVAKNQAAARKESEAKQAGKRRNKFANFKPRERDYKELERLEQEYIVNRLKAAGRATE